MKNVARLVAVLSAALALPLPSPAQADTFGTGADTFVIDFVDIGNAGNAADTTGYGGVPYEYRIGKYEISQNAINKATANGMANVTAGPWAALQPAATISWYEAAAFVNWLNTSSGHQAAYNLNFSGSWSMALWSSAEAWTDGGTNLYRHKDAFYFLPSENEWYKAAYYGPAGSNYFLYPTGSDTAPVAVSSGTDPGTAVYDNATIIPASVEMAGGLSGFGTMGQGGNVWEWTESAVDGTYSSPTLPRDVRGGGWDDPAGDLLPTYQHTPAPPDREDDDIGFRVASVPEPATCMVVLLGAGAAYCWGRRK